MKAAIFQSGGEPLEIVNIAEPEPGEGQVLLKVGRCGICGSDLHMTEKHSAMAPAKGFVLGHEIAGEVIAVGRGVDRLRVGDRVAALPITGCGQCAACLAGEPSHCREGLTFLGGGYAELALAGARECLVLPQGLSLEDGALVEPLAVALHGVRQAPSLAAAHVMVMGAGPIGLGAIYWAHRFGARRIEVIEGNPDRAEMARQMGATSVMAPDLEQNALAVMPDRMGPEVVFECVGRPGLLAAAIARVRPKGTVVSLGFCVAPEQIMAAAGAMREVTVRFPQLYTLNDYQRTVDSLDAGHVEPRMMVTGSTGLDGLPAMFEALRKPGRHCKVMVTP